VGPAPLANTAQPWLPSGLQLAVSPGREWALCLGDVEVVDSHGVSESLLFFLLDAGQPPPQINVKSDQADLKVSGSFWDEVLRGTSLILSRARAVHTER
jgi:hypothetical protein